MSEPNRNLEYLKGEIELANTLDEVYINIRKEPLQKIINEYEILKEQAESNEDEN